MTNNSKALEESVRTIFSLPQIVNIERQILDLYRKTIHSREDCRSDKKRIRQLLMERKEMLDNKFGSSDISSDTAIMKGVKS